MNDVSRAGRGNEISFVGCLKRRSAVVSGLYEPKIAKAGREALSSRAESSRCYACFGTPKMREAVCARTRKFCGTKSQRLS